MVVETSDKNQYSYFHILNLFVKMTWLEIQKSIGQKQKNRLEIQKHIHINRWCILRSHPVKFCIKKKFTPYLVNSRSKNLLKSRDVPANIENTRVVRTPSARCYLQVTPSIIFILNVISSLIYIFRLNHALGKLLEHI